MSPTTARLRASRIRTINNSARRPSCILSISLPRVRHILPGRVEYTAHLWQDLYRCRSLGDTAQRSTAGRESLNVGFADPQHGSTGWWFPGWHIGPCRVPAGYSRPSGVRRSIHSSASARVMSVSGLPRRFSRRSTPFSPRHSTASVFRRSTWLLRAFPAPPLFEEAGFSGCPFGVSCSAAAPWEEP